MYELVIFIVLSICLECGMGIIYGVGIGYNPILVFPAAIALNFVSILIVVLVMDRFLNWRVGVRNWVERRLSRGQKIIDRYGCFGIVMGVFVLSPIQLAVVGRLLGLKPSRLYPALLGGTIIVGTAFLGVALGIFRLLLA
ncbi:MAG: small multi-drug export protein [Candidatus Bathyarchaeia archaeon]